MDSSTFLPRTPSVETTTPLFSRTSRSLRPLHRTTTCMFVSSPPSASKSRSLRLMPPFCRWGLLDCDVLVDIDRMLSAGEAAPDCVLGCIKEALDWVLAVEGLTMGGRIECFLLGKPAAGRARPAITYISSTTRSVAVAKPVCAFCDKKRCWWMLDIDVVCPSKQRLR